MATVILDTHRLVGHLRDSGFTEQQATGVTEAIQAIDLANVTSKADLAQLEARLTTRMATFVGIAVAAQSAIIAAIQIFAG